MENTAIEITTEEYFNLLELKAQEEKKKQYFSDYYINKLKNQSKYCANCNKNVKHNSWFNHLQSSKHLRNKIKINNIDEK
jgi:ribosomal protein S26